MTAQSEPSHDPAIRAFGIALTTFREAAGMTKKDLAARLGCTPAFVGQIEASKNSASPQFAADLDTAFNTPMFTDLWRNIENARQILPTSFRPLADAEQDATEIRIFVPLLISGLVQTEDYARRILSLARRPEEADGLLAARMGRQELLTREHPPWLFLLIREAALRDVWPDLRKAQCAKILDTIAHNVSVQILPCDAPVAIAGAFTLLSFADAPNVAYVDGAWGYGQMLTDPRDVRRLGVVFDVIRSFALNGRDSADLIHTIMEDAREHD